ncbi:RNA polymerase sigma-70 factor (ECF subfamily) [Haloferula luteola]|uniref:RNA polymerase sigma-70 factor (ECF subfamily) n=1 Tax=Haloferula luteola TaxID=595692 RepID=A0A840V2H1_9BACT|nr:sigma-70 family RNA polymerase sigma factor [Haloferula luteola]MBB5351663.1 RNA polymerase sigma-70 factor (ECF subfamily) [Haloferula luteola]
MSAISPSSFPPTQWTRIVQAGHGTPAERQAALEHLCADYWYPLYVFARRRGASHEDAEDLTQGFFRYLLERDLVAGADRELGRLRTFLLTAFQRMMGDVRQRDHAKKRGGGQEMVPLDTAEAESRYSSEPDGFATPEAHYDRSWAMEVLHSALGDLRDAEQAGGKGEIFAVLETFLSPSDVADADYGAAATELGLSSTAVRKAVSRLRARFRDGLRDRIGATLNEPTPERVDGELAALQAALRN